MSKILVGMALIACLIAGSAFGIYYMVSGMEIIPTYTVITINTQSNPTWSSPITGLDYSITAKASKNMNIMWIVYPPKTHELYARNNTASLNRLRAFIDYIQAYANVSYYHNILIVTQTGIVLLNKTITMADFDDKIIEVYANKQEAPVGTNMTITMTIHLYIEYTLENATLIYKKDIIKTHMITVTEVKDEREIELI